MKGAIYRDNAAGPDCGTPGDEAQGPAVNGAPRFTHPRAVISKVAWSSRKTPLHDDQIDELRGNIHGTRCLSLGDERIC